MPTIFLALGSNLGDRQANLQAAVTSLAPGVSLIRQSSVYQTEPWGYTDQPLFLNQVIEARTELPPQDLLAYLKHLEHTLGREATFRYGPRVIDLDILLYGDQVVSLPGLNIPPPAGGTRLCPGPAGRTGPRSGPSGRRGHRERTAHPGGRVRRAALLRPGSIH